MPLIIINKMSWNMTEWVRRGWKSMPRINWDLKRIFLVWVVFHDEVLHTVSTSTDSLEYWISVWMILSISSIRCRNDEGKIRLINFAIYRIQNDPVCSQLPLFRVLAKVDTDYRALNVRLEKSLFQLLLENYWIRISKMGQEHVLFQLHSQQIAEWNDNFRI